MLVFYVERIEHQQRLNASGPDGVSSSHHISALILAIGRGFLTDFDLMIAKKGRLSSFGVFGVQSMPEIPTGQTWCSIFEKIEKLKAVFKPLLSRIRFESQLGPVRIAEK